MRRNRTSSHSTYVDALSIQLVRCCCGGSVSPRRSAPTSSHMSVPLGDGSQTTQPGSLPGCYSLAQCAVPLAILLRFFISQSHRPCVDLSSGGDEGIRTPGLRRAKAALSQTELHPHIVYGVVGLTGFEPVTPALSAQCSNQLSYRPGVQTRP